MRLRFFFSMIVKIFPGNSRLYPKIYLDDLTEEKKEKIYQINHQGELDALQSVSPFLTIIAPFISGYAGSPNS